MLRLIVAIAILGPLSACGSEGTKRDLRSRGSGDAVPHGGDSVAAEPRLTQAQDDEVVSTLVIPFTGDGLQLDGSAGWVVDLEDREPVEGGVAPQKYLRVKGQLTVPAAADNQAYEVGCLFVELKDNVLYRDATWLRIATTGVRGLTYQEVVLPLSVDLGGWQTVPQLSDSLTLAEFASKTLKKFDGTLCFKLDFSDAPAQQYRGEIVVQYLRKGGSGCEPDTAGSCQDPEPPAPAPKTPEPAPPAFACASAPLVLKGGQSATLGWQHAPTGRPLEIKLRADSPAYKGELGTIRDVTDSQAIYTAPAKVPTNARIIATGRPAQSEDVLPAFCEVNLIGDEDIGIPDDGEIQGITGNVFELPANTKKLPDLDAMTPVAKVVVSNLDIPERAWSSGFPGVRDLVEWFAISFRGRLIVEEGGQCSFKLTSDDGANLYLDGQKLIDNDGLHPTRSRTGSAHLTAGEHDFRVDYYQGPRYHITLQLYWRCGDASAWTIVPPEAFRRPLE